MKSVNKLKIKLLEQEIKHYKKEIKRRKKQMKVLENMLFKSEELRERMANKLIYTVKKDFSS